MGFLPTFVGGPTAFYHTTVAVESFVEEHYNAQLDRLARDGHGATHAAVAELLRRCCEDEVKHKEEAAERAAAHGDGDDDGGPPSLAVRAWARVVDFGSRAAVVVCKRI